MTGNCRNCNSKTNGNFCSNCGQSTDTHRISWHFLWHDIQHGLLHVDKGILFSAKELFTRPGHSIREFLSGKRVKHFKPISLVIVLAGIYGFMSHFFHVNLISNNFEVKGSGEAVDRVRDSLEKMSEWVSNHYSLLVLLQIPIFSLGTYICFKKTGYNFIEHFIINAFVASQNLILHIVTFPLFYAFNHSPHLKTTARIADIIGYGIAFFTVMQLFNGFSYFQRILRTSLSLAISLIIIFLLLILASKLFLHSL